MLVYQSIQPENLDVFHYAHAGAETDRLTDHLAHDYGAKASPDGEWVVFTSERTGNPDLFALNLKNRQLFQLTTFPGIDDQADFSPNGKTLVFVSNRDGGYTDIHTMPFDPVGGTGDLREVNLTKTRSSDFRPEFSQDGKHIAFSSQGLQIQPNAADPLDRGSFSAISVINPDGNGLRRLLVTSADSLFFYTAPEWSPDGHRIYFVRGRFNKALPGNSKWPDISDDGSKVVFAGKLSNSESAIFMMNADGSGVRRLTKGTGYFTQPAISPDGRMIAFVGNLEGNFEVRNGPFRIYLLSLTDPDAKPRMLEPRNGKLGRHAADMHPNFSPDGKYVAFTTSRFGFGDEPPRSFRGPQPYGEICVAPVDTTAPVDSSFPAVRVTHNKWEDGIPDWDVAPESSD